jgi:hypothetical protein
VITAGAACAEQELAHPGFPAAAGLVQREELDRGQAYTSGFGPHQVVLRRQRWGGEGVDDAVGESLGQP